MGPVEMMVIFVYLVPFLLVPIGVALWIYTDAKERAIDHPIAWSIAGFVSWVSTVPIYYALRDHLAESADDE
jgi:hypothetical protein